MQERIRNPNPASESFGAGPWDDVSDAVLGHVEVTHGPYVEMLPIVHMTIREVRGRFADVLDVAENAVAVLDGRPVDDDTRVRAGQRLTFLRDGGEKGA